MTHAIHKGDIVTIKPQWREAGDENEIWVARTDEDHGRLDISTLATSGMPIWPMSIVSSDMVEPTGKRLNPDGSIA